jgi:putative cardiolipin synthase
MNWWYKGALLALAGIIAVGCAARILNPLPPLTGRSVSRALPASPDTRLGAALAPVLASHAGRSGLYLLSDGKTAFAARALLARAAQRSIDAQYYIWHNDLTGRLMFEELRAAADRGVRVRLLLDDNTTAGLDDVLASIDAHPRIEVRLFNPFTIRWLRPLGYAVDFGRLNRRMHNKSFTIDNQATIIGGRNVGDEYFGTGDGALFVDLDALAVGPVVNDVSTDFDRYWASASAYPLNRIIHRDAAAASKWDRLDRQSNEARSYLGAVETLPIVSKLAEGTLPLEWADVELVSDDPAKALGQSDPGRLLITHLDEAIGMPRHSLDLVSGYFVPTQATVDTLTGLCRRGVAVTAVTNSYEATDVPVVHAGYAGDRKALLKGGVRLWEIRARGSRPKKLLGSGSGSAGTGSTGGVPQDSAQALHAKTFMADGDRVFIGSFNLDPRSAHLNTELGFVIRSPVLAQRMETELRRQLPGTAYEVRLDGNDLRWIEYSGDQRLIHTREPGTSRLSRAMIALLSRLPIEWLL